MIDLAEFEAELAQAETARLDGNEGKARVCARRAAGIIARTYLENFGVIVKSHSAYEQLRSLAELETISLQERGVIEHFLLKVDESYQLPVGIDLIGDARWMAEQFTKKDC